MKKTIYLIVSIIMIISLCACNSQEDLVGRGLPEITGSIAYFYGEGESAIDVFYSTSDDTKETTLLRDKIYKIGFRPSFNGSRDAVYTGDRAKFTYDDGTCVISYVGEQDNQPTYDMTITAQDDFQLKIDVDGYVQTITVCVAEH